MLVYCLSVMPASLRFTQRSSELHVMDVCFLVCICSEHRSHIQTVRVFVGPGFDSTSPAFVSNHARHSTGAHDRLALKISEWAPFLGMWVDTIFSSYPEEDSPTTCKLCLFRLHFWPPFVFSFCLLPTSFIYILIHHDNDAFKRKI